MSHNQECYRYAAPGERSLKRHHTHQPQQVRYLQGLEIRTSATRTREASRLQVLVSGNCRIYQQGSDTRTHFNLCDRLGNISLVMDSQGERVSQETWYPFGGTASWLTGNQTGAEIKFQRYAGKERDATGLMAYGWRYYAPWLMRWLNSDPAGTVDGLNLFRMVSNNPVTLFDRDGRMERWLIGALSRSIHMDLTARLNILQLHNEQESELFSSPPTATVLPANISVSDTISTAASTFEPPLPGISGDINPDTETSQPSPVAGSSLTKKKWVCKKCDEAFPSKYARIKHNEINHIKELYPCRKGCHKSFEIQELRQKHEKRVHGIKTFICDWPSCGAKFTTESYLDRHTEIHTTSKNFYCSETGCNKQFKTRYNLQAHEKTHKERQEYLCVECGLSYKNKGNLTRHNTKYHP
ncbi:MAG: RHS repeat-associated core domain-containing protein [Pantoea sp.]|uniref:RHS repeat-associated core domain-containing protein n=1 Tax=Pantoea sp. TaxID=69393 RepID=UPI0039E3FF3C